MNWFHMCRVHANDANEILGTFGAHLALEQTCDMEIYWIQFFFYVLIPSQISGSSSVPRPEHFRMILHGAINGMKEWNERSKDQKAMIMRGFVHPHSKLLVSLITYIFSYLVKHRDFNQSSGKVRGTKTKRKSLHDDHKFSFKSIISIGFIFISLLCVRFTR